MKKIFFLLLLGITPLDCFAWQNPVLRTSPGGNLILSDQGQYAIQFEPEDKKIAIYRLDDGKEIPPFMKLRLLQENAWPLEVNLKPVDPPISPLVYTGQLAQETPSYMGVELEFSFDAQTWKKLGDTLFHFFL